MTKLTVSFLFVIFGIVFAVRNPNNTFIQNFSGMLIGSGVTLFLSIAIPMIQDWDREYGYTLIPFSLSVHEYSHSAYDFSNIDEEIGTDEERRNIQSI